MKPLYSKSINQRVYTAYQEPSLELALCGIGEYAEPIQLPPSQIKNYLFDLSYLASFSVQGALAKNFLQGQLTCDVSALSPSQAVFGAQCNLQGRILTLLDLVQWQEVQAVLPADMMTGTLKSLSAPAKLSRLTLSVDEDIQLLGFYAQNGADLSPGGLVLATEPGQVISKDELCAYALGNGFHLLLVKKTALNEVVQPFLARGQLLGSLPWHTLRLMQQALTIYPDSSGAFLPHNLGLHENGRISFTKGCYKGQEIVIRMHHRAEIKYAMRYFAIETSSLLQSGQALLHPTEEKQVGELVDYSFLGGNRYFIAASLLKDFLASPRGFEPLLPP